ncbi:MAG: hypothetical protein HY791_35405 [Deltaproteobacteria bacterium]|nr:hypothetical protein [Deltaproteobacteria bacterium]
MFGDELTPAYDIVREFRERQDHEQTYRIMLHDLFGDTAPSGYNKKSKNPRRPGFQQNALTLYSWIAALAANTLIQFAQTLPAALPPGKYNRYHPRTLRRWLFVVPAEIWQTSNTLIVHLRPLKLRPLWVTIVDRFNARAVRIPWLENRRILLSLSGSRAEPVFDPAANRLGVWC